MKFKRFFKTIAISMAFTMASSSVLYANTFNDVPSSHWAYSAIDSVSNKGLIVGDLSGNYMPDRFLDKFATSIILARLLGYKATGASDDEQTYQEKASADQKTFISQYQTKFSKWNSAANGEISFLLEKGVLTSSDLDQFVIISQDGKTEGLTALTREDAAVYLVRAMGETSQAENYQYTSRFSDDSSIADSKKQSVYYLRSLGVINGDTNNNYNPKSPVTRAAIAILLDKTWTHIYGSDGVSTLTPTPTDVTTVGAVSGIIDVYYDSLNTLQIKSDSGATQIYVISDSAAITVDGSTKTKADLKAGMSIIGVVTDGKTLVSIKALSSDAPASTTATTSTTTSTTTPVTTANPNGNINYNVEGTVSAIDTTNLTVSVDTKIISPRGDIVTTTTVYSVPKSTPIVRDTTAVAFSNITVGDIIDGQSSGNTFTAVKLEVKDATINGTLTEKGTDDATSRPYYVITDDNDATKTSKVYVTSDSSLTRSGSGTVAYSDIKIGDEIKVNATFGVVNTLSATGKSSSVDGYVQQLNIASTGSFIVIKQTDDKNTISKYTVSPTTQFLYTLQIGTKVELKLDSKEVSEITVLQAASPTTVTGYVQNVYRDKIVINSTTGTNGTTSTVYYDSNTKFISSSTGNVMNVDNIKNGSQIYVVYSTKTANHATTITVLQ